MLFEVGIDTDTLPIQIDNPFNYDLQNMIAQIVQFASSKGISVDGFDLDSLIPKMTRGIAGCQGGCPSNAKRFAQAGFRDFSIQYIEGGILSVSIDIGNGRSLTLKAFPDFS
jgi:hypothetical protein